MQNPLSQTAEALDSLKEVLPEKVVINWLWPAIIAGIFIVLGVIIERVILVHLRKLAEKTEWKGDDIIIRSLRGIIIAALTIIGFFFASYSMNLPASFLLLLHKSLTVLLILCGTVMLSRMAVGFVSLSNVTEEGETKSASILVYVARATVYLIGILIILQSLGISITPLLTALGVGGLAVALALQDTLSNLFAGIHILASRKIRPGDYIRLETGQEGNVVDISWRTTSIKAPANHLIIVPNSRVASSIVMDFDQPEKEISVIIPLAVSHDSDLAKVEHVTIEVAKEVLKQISGGVASYDPLIRFSAIADSSIQFNVILRVVQFNDQYLIKHEFIRRILNRYRQEGITIPVPVHEIRMKGERS
jgi:small-conductance mechanosensitive channel